MSNLNNSNHYLNKIFSFLRDIENSNAILPDVDKALKEKEINVLSEDLFKDLYNNLLYYYKLNGKKKIESNEQKSFYKSLYELLNIIFESNLSIFKDTNAILALIYLIDFFRESKAINLEIVCDIIYSLNGIFMNISNNKIKDIVNEFEADAFETAKKCSIVFMGDFNVNIENFNDLDSFGKIMHAIQNLYGVKIPFHLQGFINYNNISNNIKPLIIKIYNYIDEINPFKIEKENSTNNNYHLFQGYS